MFNITLRELDIFLNIFDSISFNFSFDVEYFFNSRFRQKLSFSIHEFKLDIYDQNRRHVLYKMKKKTFNRFYNFKKFRNLSTK